MADRELLLGALPLCGGDAADFADPAVAHLVAEGHRVLSSRGVPGLTVDTRETAEGIDLSAVLAPGVVLEKPVRLCFGVVHPEGEQRIQVRLELGAGSSAHLVAHCLFPRAEKVLHLMQGTVRVGAGASLWYEEVHFHGPHGGIEVVPTIRVEVGEGGSYRGDFALLTGRVGKLEVDYAVEVAARGVAELTVRVYARGHDRVKVMEKVDLAGEGSRGLVKARIALTEDSRAEVRGTTVGRAAGARGHVDCLEIVKDRAVASAIPVVEVSHPLAKVTHEASIGSVDRRQLETLMAHGLSPEEATDLIVKGVLA